MPSETTHEDLESVIAEQERKIEELTKQLAVVKTAASGKTQKERARRSESVSAITELQHIPSLTFLQAILSKSTMSHHSL